MLLKVLERLVCSTLFQKTGLGGESYMKLPDEDMSVMLNTSLKVLKQRLGCSVRGFSGTFLLPLWFLLALWLWDTRKPNEGPRTFNPLPHCCGQQILPAMQSAPLTANLLMWGWSSHAGATSKVSHRSPRPPWLIVHAIRGPLKCLLKMLLKK